MGPGPTRSARVTKKVRCTHLTSLREKLERIKRYRTSRKGQTGSGLASSLAKTGLKMGSKAVNSALSRKIINKGIDNIPNMFKYRVSKTKTKNVKRALDSDIANIVVDEAQNKVSKTADSLFD